MIKTGQLCASLICEPQFKSPLCVDYWPHYVCGEGQISLYYILKPLAVKAVKNNNNKD